MTKKWSSIVNNILKSIYATANEIEFNREEVKSILFDYNDAYILVRGKLASQQSLQH